MMNEFALINHYFKSISAPRRDVLLGSGDDAACVHVPKGMSLLISTDTLVANRHFLTSWDAFDIAYKSIMVNISDIAAMGGEPAWITMSLTLPEANESWLSRFSEGLQQALNRFDVALIGGDLTKGPLTINVTIHGLVPEGQAVTRGGARPGDKIYVSGPLGAAALAVRLLGTEMLSQPENRDLMDKLLHPNPRVDLNKILRSYATAAIDLSDGLSSDLHHICDASGTGAFLSLEDLPVFPRVRSLRPKDALDFALNGGDDYELCFTVSPENEDVMLRLLSKENKSCFCIGEIVAGEGISAKTLEGDIRPILAGGYNHFK